MLCRTVTPKISETLIALSIPHKWGNYLKPVFIKCITNDPRYKIYRRQYNENKGATIVALTDYMFRHHSGTNRHTRVPIAQCRVINLCLRWHYKPSIYQTIGQDLK